jgi:hypothetical protein
MRKILAGAFWADIDVCIGKAAVCCLALTLIWVLISMGLYCLEGSRSYFEIKAVLLFKIIFTAVIFLGRYLLFAKHRRRELLKWLFCVVFLVAIGIQAEGILKTQPNWIYLLLKICDALVWAICITSLVEVLGGLFRFWNRFEKVSAAKMEQFWLVFKEEIIALGILLTLLAGLIYYYLTSFYLVDTLFYSYLLLVPVLVAGLGLYATIRAKVQGWLCQDISLLDQEIDTYLQWQHIQVEPEINQKILWLEYLTIIRRYLVQIRRPRFSLKIWSSYLIFSAFILILPYVFGLVVEVGSFK